jgi:hypothetical protein
MFDRRTSGRQGPQHATDYRKIQIERFKSAFRWTRIICGAKRRQAIVAVLDLLFGWR